MAWRDGFELEGGAGSSATHLNGSCAMTQRVPAGGEAIRPARLANRTTGPIDGLSVYIRDEGGRAWGASNCFASRLPASER